MNFETEIIFIIKNNSYLQGHVYLKDQLRDFRTHRCMFFIIHIELMLIPNCF